MSIQSELRKRSKPADNALVKEISRFLKDESGQELMEQAVLWAFIVLVIAIVVSGMNGINSAWGIANTQLSSTLVSTS